MLCYAPILASQAPAYQCRRTDPQRPQPRGSRTPDCTRRRPSLYCSCEYSRGANTSETMKTINREGEKASCNPGVDYLPDAHALLHARIPFLRGTALARVPLAGQQLWWPSPSSASQLLGDQCAVASFPWLSRQRSLARAAAPIRARWRPAALAPIKVELPSTFTLGAFL